MVGGRIGGRVKEGATDEGREIVREEGRKAIEGKQGKRSRENG